ncbi:MAG: hypothetical protein ACJ790_08765 [Myxococcaceae bacterium]
MSFLSGIGKAIGGLAKGVSKVAHTVTNVINFIKQPVDKLLAPVKNIVGGALDKLPFGIGKLAKPFVDKFFDSALGFLAGGPLGGLSFLTGLMPTIDKVADIAGTVGDVADKVGGFLNPDAQNNVANIFAEAQAGLIN